jgi:hypothetical protein
MADLLRTFIAGRMNKDLDERLLPDGEYRDAVNVTIDTSEGSNIGAIQNAYGNALVTDVKLLIESQGVTITQPLITIGAVSYEPTNLLYWFVVSDEFEGIFEYNQNTNVTVLILGCTDNQLGFNKNHLITGVNYVIDGQGGGLLIWNDNLNPPRKINVNRCKAYSIDDPRISDDINLIVAPPLNSPSISLSTFTSPNLDPNNIEDKFVYFSTRYKYSDNEYSAMSPLSSVAFNPKALNVDVQTGENKGMLNEFNQVEVTLETGNQFVKEIQLLVWESRTLNVKIVETLNKEELNILDNSTYSFFFMNNKTYAALPSDQVTRLFDNVPLKALAQDIIGSRLVMGNYTQFRDLIGYNTNDFIDVNYTVGYISDPVSPSPKQTWRSDRDYEIGIAYLDDYGRMTTVLTSVDGTATSSTPGNNQSNSVYISPNNSSTANSLIVNIKNEAPAWASGYRFFVKQSKGEYYNLFPVTFIKDNLYRYFLINEADRDKIKVNGYVIFKSANGSPTNSNKKFKVLELDYKQANFNNISGAVEGLYFKIKADYSDTFLDIPTQNSYSYLGSGRGPSNNSSGSQTPAVAQNNIFYISAPIYYSVNGTPNTGPGISVNQSASSSLDDVRISIEIVNSTTFRWTIDVGQNWWLANLPISTSPITLTSGDTVLVFSFDSLTGYTPSDKWVVNVRSGTQFQGTPLQPNGGYGLPKPNTPYLAAYNPQIYGGHAAIKGPGAIYAGANISIDILNDGAAINAPGQNATSMSWVSDKDYVDIEEWFWQSGAYQSFIQYNQNGVDIHASSVTFRNGIDVTQSYNTFGFTSNVIEVNPASFEKWMLVRGFGLNQGSSRNEISVQLKVTQTPPGSKLTAETVPTNDDVDIYYEMSRTYPIVAGRHIALWSYNKCVGNGSNVYLVQDSHTQPHYFKDGQSVYVTATNIPAGFYNVVSVPDRYSIEINYTAATALIPGGVSDNSFDKNQTSALNGAVIVLNNTNNKNSDYNAYCYGNGVESNRILDGFNQPWLKYSLRANSVIENYEQQVKDASLTYSGLYRWDSSINRLNEFNLSVANFKNLDKNFGSVQKLYARTTDLLVLHQDKITSVLYGKNLLVDAVGGGSVASVPEVLGTQIALPYEFGISSNPESFATWGNRIYFADARRGVVLQMQGDEVIQISRLGMSDYFRDMMLDTPNYAKLGAYDPYNHNYVIASTNRRNTPCDITINPTAGSFPYNTAGNLEYLFAISGTTSWRIEVLDNGFGTNWIELPAYCQAGVGSQDIYGRIQNNITGSQRSVIIRVVYCSSHVDYTLTQGRGPKTDFNIITLGKDELKN